LLGRARQRDPEAWARLVSLYTPLVRHWCHRGGLRAEDVEDVTRDVFKALAAGLGNFRGEGGFRAWLRGIARHKVLDVYRGREQSPLAVGGSEAQAWLQQVTEPASDPPEESDLVALYHRGLELVRGEFQPSTWQAFWRTAVQGQSPADAGAELGMSAGAVRVAKSRVLARLREELGELLPGP
jgi:RNA polymerase sigma-70 factor (ECF subfamily)